MVASREAPVRALHPAVLSVPEYTPDRQVRPFFYLLVFGTLFGAARAQAPDSLLPPEPRALNGRTGVLLPDGPMFWRFRYVPDSVVVFGEGVAGDSVVIHHDAFEVMLHEMTRLGATFEPPAPMVQYDREAGATSATVTTVLPVWWPVGLGALVSALTAFLGGLWIRGRAKREQIARQAGFRERESERSRFAREIHDGSLQDLCALQMRLVPVEGSPVDLEAARQQIADTVAELRSVCQRLRPPGLETLGLVRSLQSLVVRARNSHPALTIHLDADGHVDAPPDAQLALYRIAQEALNNALSHASASCIRLSVRTSGDDSRLVIEDDGQGMRSRDPRELAESGHFGIIGMIERARASGIRLSFGTPPSGGTRVTAVLPSG